MVETETQAPLLAQHVVVLPVAMAAEPIGGVDHLTAEIEPFQVAVGVVQGQARKAELGPGTGLPERGEDLGVPGAERLCLCVAGTPAFKAVNVVWLVVDFELGGVGFQSLDDGRHSRHELGGAGPRAWVESVVVQPDNEFGVGVLLTHTLKDPDVCERHRLDGLYLCPAHERIVGVGKVKCVAAVDPNAGSVLRHPLVSSHVDRRENGHIIL